MLFISIAAIAVAISIPYLRRHRALAYLDAHDGYVELSSSDEWITERFGDWAKCFRDVDHIFLPTGISDESLSHISVLDEVWKLDLIVHESPSKWLTTRGVQYFEMFTRLQYLTLDYYREGEATDDELVAALFATQPPLKGLTVHSSQITYRSLNQICGIPSITHLHLHLPSVGDSDFNGLQPMPNLELLDLQATAVSPTLIAWVTQSPRLQFLDLMGTDLSDEMVAQIATITTLESLHIGVCRQLTEDSIEPLTRLTGLRILSLSGDIITPATIEHLKRMPSLDLLEIWDLEDPELKVELEKHWRVQYASYESALFGPEA